MRWCADTCLLSRFVMFRGFLFFCAFLLKADICWQCCIPPNIDFVSIIIYTSFWNLQTSSLLPFLINKTNFFFFFVPQPPFLLKYLPHHHIQQYQYHKWIKTYLTYRPSVSLPNSPITSLRNATTTTVDESRDWNDHLHQLTASQHLTNFPPYLHRNPSKKSIPISSRCRCCCQYCCWPQPQAQCPHLATLPLFPPPHSFWCFKSSQCGVDAFIHTPERCTQQWGMVTSILWPSRDWSKCSSHCALLINPPTLISSTTQQHPRAYDNATPILLFKENFFKTKHAKCLSTIRTTHPDLLMQ